MIRALNMTAERMAELGVLEMHDIERARARIGGGEGRRNDGEVFGDVVRDAERGERSPGHQHLLAGLDDLDQLGGIGIEVDHVAGFLGGLGAGVHCHGHIGLGERGASLVPSPVIATSRPSAWCLRMSASFASGVASAR